MLVPHRGGGLADRRVCLESRSDGVGRTAGHSDRIGLPTGDAARPARGGAWLNLVYFEDGTYVALDRTERQILERGIWELVGNRLTLSPIDRPCLEDAVYEISEVENFDLLHWELIKAAGPGRSQPGKSNIHRNNLADRVEPLLQKLEKPIFFTNHISEAEKDNAYQGKFASAGSLLAQLHTYRRASCTPAQC